MDIDDELRALIAQIKDEADGLDNAPASQIIATRYCLNLRDDPDGSYGIVFMDDEALRQTVVEDLLNIVSWRMEGKEVGGDLDHLTRFLEGTSKERAIEAFNSPMVQSFVIVQPDGTIELDPEHMQDAMDYAGVWLDGWETLTEGTVYKRGPGL